jgi:hypothetical protein
VISSVSTALDSDRILLSLKSRLLSFSLKNLNVQHRDVLRRNFAWEAEQTALQQIHRSRELANVCESGYALAAPNRVLSGGPPGNRIPSFRAPQPEEEGRTRAW